MGIEQEGQAAEWRHEVTAHVADKVGEDFKGSKDRKHFSALLCVHRGTCVKIRVYKILATGHARIDPSSILGLVLI